MKSRWQAVIMAGALFIGQIVVMGMPPSASALTCSPGNPCFGSLLFAPRGTLGGEYWDTLKVGDGVVATTWSESEVDLSIYNFSSVVGTMLNLNLTQVPIPIDVLYQNTQSTLAISFVPPAGYEAQVGDVLSLSIADSLTFNSLATPEVRSVKMDLEIGGVQFVVISTEDNGVGLLGVAPAPVPEPATMLLFGTGLAGLAYFGRRRQK